MKNILINSFILLFTITSLAQTIVPLETRYTTNFLARDVYFKDVNGVLNKFLGTWKYENTSTNTVFEITFSKIENNPNIHNCSEDILTAKFKLSINNIELYKTYTNNYGTTNLASGFYPIYTYFPNGDGIETPPSINRYHMGIAEPGFLDDIDASDLTIEYEQVNFGNDRLHWKNEVDKSYYYITNQQANIYQMPLEMVLIKQ